MIMPEMVYFNIFFLNFSPSKSDNDVFILATCGNMVDFLMKNQIKHQDGPLVSMAEL